MKMTDEKQMPEETYVKQTTGWGDLVGGEWRNSYSGSSNSEITSYTRTDLRTLAEALLDILVVSKFNDSAFETKGKAIIECHTPAIALAKGILEGGE